LPTGPVTAAEQLSEHNSHPEGRVAFRAAFEKAMVKHRRTRFVLFVRRLADLCRRRQTRHGDGSQAGLAGIPCRPFARALFATRGRGDQGVYSFSPADRHGVDERSRIMVQIENGKYKLLP